FLIHKLVNKVFLFFIEKVSDRVLCDLILSELEIQYLKEAIEENYYFEFVIDDIPVRDFVGHLEESGYLPHSHKVFLWTHNHFTFYYNEEKIIFVNTTKEHNPVSLDGIEAPLTVTPSFSVSWIPTSTPFKNRDALLQDNSFFPKSLEIHWLSVINSSVLVFLLICFVVIILTRILKNDFARYNVESKALEEAEGDEYGWKIIHADVFRIPK
ncbi:UNVERIFIED_CONTAM: hypothetical protein GTU68_032062, partial [Idotea baltica]|nr:hypothetical protein [Idotea baltica]